MTVFFNKKEEVIDIRITEYGKHLLSLGLMKPVYYAFFDDEILYDPACAGFSEHQNKADKRIKEETPALKVIASRTSAEDRVNTFTANVEVTLASLYSPGPAIPMASSEIAFAFQEQQPYADKVATFNTPLGNSSLTSQYDPSWSLLTAKNEMVSSSHYLSNTDGVIEQIPQVDIILDYKTYARSGSMVTARAISDFLDVGTQAVHPKTFICLKQNYVLIDLLEENTTYLKENFDVEVIYMGPSGSTATTEDIQMSFARSGSTDVPHYINSPSSSVPGVEYYMSVHLDKEIDLDLLEDAGLELGAPVGLSSKRLDFSRNLYMTDEEDPC